MASGKQILLSLLCEYSQRKVTDNEIDLVTERLKAGLLLHGSSSNAMWDMVDHMAWVKVMNETEGAASYLQGQGLGLKENSITLSNLFDMMTQNEGIAEAVKEAYPNISAESYKAGMHMIWLLLKSLEWASYHEPVESGGDLEEKEKLLKAYQEKLIYYKNDSEDYS